MHSPAHTKRLTAALLVLLVLFVTGYKTVHVLTAHAGHHHVHHGDHAHDADEHGTDAEDCELCKWNLPPFEAATYAGWSAPVVHLSAVICEHYVSPVVEVPGGSASGRAPPVEG